MISVRRPDLNWMPLSSDCSVSEGLLFPQGDGLRLLLHEPLRSREEGPVITYTRRRLGASPDAINVDTTMRGELWSLGYSAMKVVAINVPRSSCRSVHRIVYGQRLMYCLLPNGEHAPSSTHRRSSQIHISRRGYCGFPITAHTSNLYPTRRVLGTSEKNGDII